MTTKEKDKTLKAVADPFTGEVDDDVKSLGEASTEALAGFGGEEQQPLVPAYKAKFVGMAFNSIETPPNMDEEMVFTVTGKVVGLAQERRKDGELIDICKIQVEKVHRADLTQ